MSSQIEELERFLQGEGLKKPPIPSSFVSELRQRGPRHFATREDTVAPDDTDSHLLRVHKEKSDYLLLAQGGGGRTSQALHYYLVWHPLALFIKMPWGGAYAKERDRERIDSCFARAHELVELRLRLDAVEPLVVFASDMYPSMIIRPGEAPDRDVDGALNALGTALGWLDEQ